MMHSDHEHRAGGPLRGSLRDLYNAESQVQFGVEWWAQATDSDKLKELFTDRIEQANRHINRVRETCNAMGVSPAGEECYGVQGLIQEDDKYVEDSKAAGPMRDAELIADAQRIEHYGIAGYSCARTYAEHLGLDEPNRALQENVDESAAMDERLDEVAELLLHPEVREATA